MTDIALATSEADSLAAEVVRKHHEQMSQALDGFTRTLVGAARAGDEAAVELARQDVLRWCQTELVPHARAEEVTLYQPARASRDGRLLVEAMLGEHALILELVSRLEAPSDDLVGLAVSASTLSVVLDSHIRKENEFVLPLLAAMPEVSVAGLLEQMHRALGQSGEPGVADGPAAGCGGHACTCGELDPDGYPELDARTIPHAIRHATIFGALDSIATGGGLVLIAPHDPQRLLDQMDDRWPGRFDVAYLQSGPEDWRLALTRSRV